MADDRTHDNQPATRAPTRRQFLGATALAGAAAVIGAAGTGTDAKTTRFVPAVKPGRVNRPGAGDPIRIAVIGTGGMGTGHAYAFSSFAERGQADVQVVAIADVCDERRAGCHKGLAERQPDVDVMHTRDYRDILAREDIHGVLIGSPEHWHAQHAIDALHAGKDVYCEKPLTLRLDQAMAVRKVVLAHPEQIFQVGTQMIMLPKYQEARKALKDGRIGTPIWSQTSYCRNSPDGEWNYYGINDEWAPGRNLDWNEWLGYLGPREWDPKVFARWRRYRDYSTGIIGDLLVHVMTPMIFALDAGWPTRVVCTGAHMIDKDMENHDQVNMTVQFESGHTMVVAGATNNEVGLETMIRGDMANMYLNGRHVDIRPERAYVDDIDREEIKCPDIGNDQDQLRLNWLECMRSRQPAASNIDLASKVMVAVDLATRSAWDGHAYNFDPATLKPSRA
ncbi:MAG: Gfo/Idh/MocA family oxidoreductase [Planctomycetota bacterium]